MVTYKISTGELFADAACIGQGYAGNGPALNNPLATDVKGHGPLPCGLYEILPPRDFPESVGAYAMPLVPDPANVMFGRSGFFVHGDNPATDHTASDGCIVTARLVREIIAQHTQLTVIA